MLQMILAVPMQATSTFGLLLLAASLFTSAVQAAPIERPLAPGVQAWQSNIRTGSSEFELRAAAVSWTDETAMMSVVRVPEGERRSGGLLQNWTTRLDARDPSVADWVPAASPEIALSGKRGARLLGSLVAATSDRTFVSWSIDEKGIHRLTRLDTAAEKVVALGLPSVEVRGLRSHAPQRFVVVGSAGMVPFCAELDSDGNVLRKWVLRDIVGAVVVAQPTADGGLVALIDTSTSSDAALTVARVQADGVLAARVERAGQAMDLVSLRDGSLAVAYARSRVATYEVRLLTLTPDASAVRGEVELLVTPTTPARVRLGAAPQGGVVVAGVRERGLWVARLDGAGRTLWDARTDPRRRDDLELTLGVDLQTDDRGRFLLAYSALVTEGRRQISVVRALRFNLD